MKKLVNFLPFKIGKVAFNFLPFKTLREEDQNRSSYYFEVKRCVKSISSPLCGGGTLKFPFYLLILPIGAQNICVNRNGYFAMTLTLPK